MKWQGSQIRLLIVNVALEEGIRKGLTSEQSRYIGSMLGLAIGDALGAPVEFLSTAELN